MENVKKKLADIFENSLSWKVLPENFVTPPNPKLGDLAYPTFQEAKKQQKNPAEIAKTASEKIHSDWFTVTAAGPYINISMNPNWVCTELLDEVSQPHFGHLQNPEPRERWVLEFSSPNIAKPFQIYHLRGTALGAVLNRVAKTRGISVTTINHLGDWGTQYGKLSIALQIYGSNLPEIPTIENLVDLYVRFHKDAEINPDLENQAREAFTKLESGDPELLKLWQKCVEISLKEFKKIYQLLDIDFDHYWGESFYQPKIDPLMNQLKSKKLLEEDDGALIVRLDASDEKNQIPPCLIRKNDGSTLYATRDLAAAIYRAEKIGFDRMIYIVGGEQKLHFKQIFGVLHKMGFEWASKLEHVPTGIYRFGDQKMSTRKGNFTTFESALHLAKSRVQEILATREHLDQSSQDKLAEEIALAAILFHDLKSDPARDVDFNLESMLDFEGETGPYLQYAHTRCLSLLKKAKEKKLSFESKEFSKDFEFQEAALRLIKTLSYYPEALEKVIELKKATPLAQFLLDVAHLFGSFYKAVPVLQSEDSWLYLRLIQATEKILADGLSLLGIKTPGQM